MYIFFVSSPTLLRAKKINLGHLFIYISAPWPDGYGGDACKGKKIRENPFNP
jgi:hypothetical protein